VSDEPSRGVALHGINLKENKNVKRKKNQENNPCTLPTIYI
jgi:hypothetical protein